MKTLDETNLSPEKVNEMLELNRVSGEYFEKHPTQPELPEGWEKVYDKKDKNTNFKGVIYQNQNGEYAAVFLGTDVKNAKDWQANAEMFSGKPNKQCEKAVEFYEKNIESKNIPPEKVTVVGNSEGGREVVEVLSKTSAENGVTFNGFTKVNTEDYPPENFEKLINFRTKDDIVSKCGTTIGTDYIVPVKQDVNLKPVYKAIQAHRIDNIDKITNENAIPAKDYEEITGERFKNKYGEGKLKSYEIGEIPPELYPIVDPDVNEKLAKGEVENAILNETKPNTSSIPDNTSISDFDIDKFNKEQQEKLDNISKDIMENIYTSNTTPAFPEPTQITYPSIPQPDFTPPEKEEKEEEPLQFP